MFEREAVVINPLGLHARPATLLVKMCLKYKSDIKIQAGEKQIDPRSIMSIMGSAVSQNTAVVVTGHGDDAEDAVNEIAEFINTFTE